MLVRPADADCACAAIEEEEGKSIRPPQLPGEKYTLSNLMWYSEDNLTPNARGYPWFGLAFFFFTV